MCGGIAQHFGIDPLWVRLAAVGLTVAGGSGIALYAAGWLLIPEDGADDSLASGFIEHERRHDHPHGRRPILPIVLGFVVLMGVIHHHQFLGGAALAAAVLIGLAALGFFPSGSRFGGLRSTPYEQPRPPAQPSPWASDATFAPDEDEPESHDPGDALLREASRIRNEPYADFSTYGHVADPPTPPIATLMRRRRPGPLFAAVLLVPLAPRRGRNRNSGGVRAVGAAPGSFLAWTVVGGLVVIAASRLGRAAGVVALALVVIGGLAALGASAASYGSGIGQRVYRPASVAELDHSYRLGIGDMTLDLSALPAAQLAQAAANGQPVEVEGHVRNGHLLVMPPAGVRTVVDAHVGAGKVRIGEQWSDGVGAQRHSVIGPAGPEALHLDLEVGLGQVELSAA